MSLKAHVVRHGGLFILCMRVTRGAKASRCILRVFVCARAHVLVLMQSGAGSMMEDEAVTAPLDADAPASTSASSSSRSRLKTMFSRNKRKAKGDSATLPAVEDVTEYPKGIAFNIPSGQRVKHRPPKLVDHDWEEEEEMRAAAAAAAAAGVEARDPPPPPKVSVAVSEEGGKAAVKLYPSFTPEVLLLTQCTQQHNVVARPGLTFLRLSQGGTAMCAPLNTRVQTRGLAPGRGSS